MDKKFYIIGKHFGSDSGLTWIVFHFLLYIIAGIKMGRIPVIDLTRYNNPYFKDNRIHKDNVFEYYFEQPLGYSPKDIDEEQDALNSSCTDIFKISFPDITDFPVELKDYKMDKKLEKYKDAFNKYIRFNAETKKYIDKKYEEIIGDEKEVLGVFARGTDYTERRTKDHCIQPKISVLIKKIKSVLKEFPEIKKIYLATEDSDVYNKFKNEFKDILLDNNQYRISYKNKENKYKFLNEVAAKRENHSYNLGLEYLTSLYILSRCKYFVGGRAGGTIAAYYMSNGYKYYYSFNLGRYGRGKERIFSTVTETSNGVCHKVYNLFGFKIKFKKQII